MFGLLQLGTLYESQPDLHRQWVRSSTPAGHEIRASRHAGNAADGTEAYPNEYYGIRLTDGSIRGSHPRKADQRHAAERRRGQLRSLPKGF